MNIKKILRKIFNFPRNKRLDRKILQLDLGVTGMEMFSRTSSAKKSVAEIDAIRIPATKQEIERLRKERNSLL
jgi:hypothetical protein